jgi:3-dehydro-glucose-6-phosphate---glutamate transaminase
MNANESSPMIEHNRNTDSSQMCAWIAGDSSSLHRLLLESSEQPRRYQVENKLANRKLAEALEGEGRGDPWLQRRLFFGSGGCPGAVRFLPRERLLSPEEKSAACERFSEVLRTGEFTSGGHIDAFEAAIAELANVPCAVGTSSGTDALVITLRALGVGAGDEVIMPANSFAATENAVFACGARPVLADVGMSDYNLDPDSIEAKITPRTRAILAVHLYGKLADVEPMAAIARSRGLHLVEDACQAIGVTGVGHFSDAAVLSFNPFKNFGLCGKAGAILTRNQELAGRCRAIGYHGFQPGLKNVKRHFQGYNARIDNTMAAIAMGLLPHASLNNLRRAYLARRYLQALAPLALREQVGLPEFSPDHAWHLFPVQILGGASRDGLRRWLWEQASVETDVYYPVLTHQQATPDRQRLFRDVSLPATELLASRVLHLPLYHHLTLEEQDRVIRALYDGFAQLE